jgi:hypothetical protein
MQAMSFTTRVTVPAPEFSDGLAARPATDGAPVLLRACFIGDRITCCGMACRLRAAEIQHKPDTHTIGFPISGKIAHSSELLYSMDQGRAKLARCNKPQRGYSRWTACRHAKFS